MTMDTRDPSSWVASEEVEDYLWRALDWIAKPAIWSLPCPKLLMERLWLPRPVSPMA